MECTACKLVELSLASLMSIEKEKLNIKKWYKRDKKRGKRREERGKNNNNKILKYIF
jgi:hypothetical protein